MLAAGMLAAAMGSIAPARASQASSTSTQPAGHHDFDFLLGHWKVHHRRLKAGTNEWVEFDGTCNNRALMDGSANLEEHWKNAPGDGYRALGLRAYDPKTTLWAIWWLDGRSPHGELDPPLKGSFEKGVGTFR